MQVAHQAGKILKRFGYSEHEIELAKIAGYMHDIGNAINRSHHAEYGGLLANEILKKSDMLENTMKQLMIRIEDVLQRRSGGKIRIGAIVFSNEYGILGKTKTADMLLEDIMENNYG